MRRIELNTVLWQTLARGADLVLGVGRTREGLGLTVQVNVRGGGAATVYAAATGGTTLANPLTSDPSTGRVPGWLPPEDYDLVVSGTGFAGFTRSIRIAPDPADVSNLIAEIAGLEVGVSTSGPATIHYYGTVTDTDGAAAAHAAWAGLVKSVTDPAGTVDQFTYDGSLRLASFREYGVTRTLTYGSSGPATDLLTGVS